MEIFNREKAFHVGKEIRKNDFAPSEKFSCYAPAKVLFQHPAKHVIIISGVARAFPGGRVAHPEDQNEEENEERLRKKKKKKKQNIQENEEKLRKCSYLAHSGVRGWLRP